MASDFSIEIMDPAEPEGTRVDAIIPTRLYSMYYKHYPVRYENLCAAKFVLENPLRIFSGVRAFNEGGWCFTGRPASWYIKEAITAPFPDTLIFAVYMNPRYYVYECRAEKAAADDKNCPDNWQNRYKALVWKTTS